MSVQLWTRPSGSVVKQLIRYEQSVGPIPTGGSTSLYSLSLQRQEELVAIVSINIELVAEIQLIINNLLARKDSHTLI